MGIQNKNKFKPTCTTTANDTTPKPNGHLAKMDEFNDELSKIVGLPLLKQQLQEWAKGMLLDEKRRAVRHNIGPRKLPHMAFLGNPGTRKATVARILGRLLRSVGVLSSDKVTKVQCKDLVGERPGLTRPKTRKKINEAMGGILLVNEAYRLVPQKSARDRADYGAEAMEEIMSGLENRDLMVVFAGCTESMDRVFWSNEEFRARVTHFFRFDNFTCEDMASMVFKKMSKPGENSRVHGLELHRECTFKEVVGVIQRNSTERLRNHINRGMVDHMLDCARQNLDSRLTFDSNEEELLTMRLEDLEAGLKIVTGPVSLPSKYA